VKFDLNRREFAAPHLLLARADDPGR